MVGAKSRDRSSGDFAPTADRVDQLRNTGRPYRFAFIPHFICANFLFFWSLKVHQKNKRRHVSPRKSASIQLNLSLWWRHSIYVWRHNGARRHAIAKHYEYFVFENCTLTAHGYWSKNPIEPLYIYNWQNKLRLTRAIFVKLSCISKLLKFTLSISASPFEVLPLCFCKSCYLRNYFISIYLLIPAYGQIVTITTSQD